MKNKFNLQDSLVENSVFTIGSVFSVKGKDIVGTGLGLYIVQFMVKNFGGDIWFESEENVGSTFHVELPVGIAH